MLIVEYALITVQFMWVLQHSLRSWAAASLQLGKPLQMEVSQPKLFPSASDSFPLANSTGGGAVTNSALNQALEDCIKGERQVNELVERLKK